MNIDYGSVQHLINGKTQSACAFALLLVGAAPLAAAADAAAPVELDPIVVVASKSPRPMSEVAGQVSVIDASQIRQHVLEGLDDLLLYEPGLETESGGTRFGVSSFNIRGIGGNRVAVEVDGVPLRDGFAIGSYSNGGQNLVETDRVKRLEVLHGPASSLYGSDALGGVLAFTTWDPADLVARGDGEHWFGLRGGYRDADRSSVLGATGAWASGAHGALLSATLRDGRESDHNNPAAQAGDANDWRSEDYFFRYSFDTAAAHRLRLTVEDFSRENLANIHSILGYSRFASTTALSGDDRDESTRLLVDFEFSTPGWERGVVRVFSSQAQTRQLTLEERATAPVPARFERFFQYQTELQGLELNSFRRFTAGAVEHRLGMGIEYLRTQTEELRDGFQQNLGDGSITRTVLGETLPVRDFPNSTVNEIGVFLQDEISFGRWEAIPAVRWDHFDLDPRPDALYLEDFPEADIVGISASEVSPRLGLIRKFGDGWSMYGQYVRGFRAPPHEDVNIGLDISVFRFRALPNPDLRSETSDGYEIGLRQFTAGRRFSLALFDTDYDDFIESRVPIGVDPDSGYLLFQSRNISRARIRGLDLRYDQDLAAWTAAWSGWRLRTALYWSEGDNLDNGQALNSVSPPQAVIGLAWQEPDRRWSAGLTGSFTRRQDRVDQSGQPRFETPGFAIFDLTAGLQLSQRLGLNFSVRNLTDRQYWRWSDVARLAPQDPMLQLLSRPGRNYGLSLRLDW
jgi:hemoglobin/transferrin/lactoferrin receptor protein